MKTVLVWLVKRCNRQFPRLLAAGVAATALSAGAQAAEAGFGTLRGRVINPATHEYLYPAEVTLSDGQSVFTRTDGNYVFSRVSEGPVTVTVRYTGFETGTATVQVAGGRETVQDFELAPQDVIKMEAVTVSAPVIGDAKAIMDQRASLNFRNVMASDSFGENPDGNVGEFLKLMPGVTIDYAFIQARGLRLNGLDPKYASMTQDGVSLSSAGTAGFDANSRSFDMDAFSISSIEAVELNKTLTASMDASSVAGNVNLRSKNAFDRKGRLITTNFSLTANSLAMTTGKSPGWMQETQYKIGPNVSLSYADVFLDRRLGIVATFSDSSRWSPRDYQEIGYDYSAMATRGPLINRLQFGDEAVMVRGTTFGLNADFKVSDRLVLSWRSGYSHRSLPGLRRLFDLITNPANSLPESTLTHVVTKASGSSTRLEFTSDVLTEKITNSLTFSPRFRYTLDNATLTGGFDYSLGTAEYSDVSAGFFESVRSRLSAISWEASRSDPFSTDWTVMQLSGRPWLDPASWNLDSAISNNVRSRERKGTTEKMAGYLDGVFTLHTRHPITLKTGLKSREVNFKLRGLGQQRWTYVGPTGNQRAPEAKIPTETIYSNTRDWLSGIPDWPRPDRQRLYQIYLAFPEYFTQDEATSFREKLIYPRSVKETIDSAYLEGTSEVGDFRFDLGLRYERTKTVGKRVEQIPSATIAADRPDLVPGTIPYVLYQYHNGIQRKSYGSYDDFFLSGGAKYRIRPNLDAQFSFGDGILRPNYNNLAGAISIDESDREVTVPNPELKPERSTKYYAGLSYYFEPAGALNVGVYVLRLKDLQLAGRPQTREEAGYGDYPEFDGYDFITFSNEPGYQETRGFEVDYRQQLTFLPGVLKGLSVYGSYSRVIADRERPGVVNRSGSGGLSFRYKRLSARLNGTWQGEYMTAFLSGATGNFYMDERAALDAEIGVSVFGNSMIYLNGRNITDAPFRFYGVPAKTGQHLEDNVARYGAFWTIGIKSRF